MFDMKIIETTGKCSNEEFVRWYDGKVVEVAKFFIKKMPVDPSIRPPLASSIRMTVKKKELVLR